MTYRVHSDPNEGWLLRSRQKFKEIFSNQSLVMRVLKSRIKSQGTYFVQLGYKKIVVLHSQRKFLHVNVVNGAIIAA